MSVLLSKVEYDTNNLKVFLHDKRTRFWPHMTLIIDFM